MTDYQIKKELENEIQKCEDNARPYAYIGRELLENTVDLIKRQRAEIAKLEEYIYRCKSGEEYWVKCLLERPNEAIREFAEEIKKRASRIFITNDQDGDEHITSYQFAPETIDDLVREMVGDTYEWHKKYDNQTDKGGEERGEMKMREMDNACCGCVYENIDDTTEDIAKCVSCKRNVEYAKNDYYMRKEDAGMKKLLVSDITKTIYLTNAKPIKDHPDLFEATGEKQDYTNEAIRAVFEWFMANFKENEPNEAFEVKFGDCPYILQMIKRSDHLTEKYGRE